MPALPVRLFSPQTFCRQFSTSPNAHLHVNADFSSFSWLGHSKRIQYDHINNLPFMFTAPSSTNMKCFLSSANPLFRTQCENICCSNNKDNINNFLNKDICEPCDCEATIDTTKNDLKTKSNIIKTATNIIASHTNTINNGDSSDKYSFTETNLTPIKPTTAPNIKVTKCRNKNKKIIKNKTSSSDKSSDPIDLTTYHEKDI